MAIRIAHLAIVCILGLAVAQPDPPPPPPPPQQGIPGVDPPIPNGILSVDPRIPDGPPVEPPPIPQRQVDVDPPVPQSSVQVNLSPVKGAYKGTVSVRGNDYNLHLQNPTDSVFSSNFKFYLAETGAHGRIQMRELPLSKEAMEMSERSLYVDEETKAVFRVKHVMGEIQLHGHLDNMHISHDGENHFAIVHDAAAEEARIHDYINLNRTLVPDERVQSRQSRTTSEPELLYIIDTKQWENLGKDGNKAYDYLSMFTRAMNNRYATSSDPQIRMKVASAVANTERSSQPYMEQSKSGDGSNSYDMNAALDKFAKFMYQNRDSYEKHDMSPLMSGEEWKTKDSNGRWQSGIAGLAYVGTACLYDDRGKISYKTSVNADQGAVWRGVHTMAHELAHNLNCPHDGDGDASSCPWKDGYIMSYEGWGQLNKFKFSSCSKNLQKQYINSEQGRCLRENNSGSQAWSAATQDLGDRFSLDKQCQMLTGRSDGRRASGKSNDEICRNLSCNYNDRCDSNSNDQCIWTVTLNTHPFDRSPCDNNGNRCINGYCTSG